MTIVSNDLMNLARSLTGADLGKRIETGGAKYMTEGEHDVRVAVVDCNQLGQNKLTIKYQNAAGQEQNDMLFVVEPNKKTGVPELNWKVQATLGMLIPSIEAYDAVLAELAHGNGRVFELLTGLTGRITLARGKGFGPAQPQPHGGYVVVNTQRPEEAYLGATVEDAQAQAQAAGLKKAYVNVVRYLATNGEANIKLFAQGMANLHKPKAPTTPFQVKSVAGFGRAV